MFILSFYCIDLTCQQGSVQNSSSQALAVCELRNSDIQAGFRKGRGIKDQTANIHWIIKQRNSRKTSTSASLTMLKLLTVDYNRLGKILQEMGIPAHFTCLLKNLYAGQKATFGTIHGTTGSKLGKQCIKAVYCHNVYLTYTQSTSCEMPGWMKHKLESRFLGKISTTSDRQMIPV